MSLLSLWTVNFLNVLSYLIPHTSWDKAEVVKGLMQTKVKKICEDRIMNSIFA
jgi:hypothetical protein